MAINFAGYLFDDSGTRIQSATVKLLQVSDGVAEASTTTDSNGYWAFSEADQDTYDVEISNATGSKRLIKWSDQISLKEIDVRNSTGNTTPAATFTNLTNAVSNQVAVFSGANSTRADGDEIYLSFKLADSAGNIDEFARMTVDATDVTTTEEDGQIRFSVLVDGTLTDVFTINSTESAGTSMTLDVSGDLTLDADGGDIFFKDGGTTFGSATNNSGNLILKSGTTTAATFSGANVTFAGTVDATTDFTLGDTVITDGVITDTSGLSIVANTAVTGTLSASGLITASAGITSTAASNSFGASSFGDADITNVGDIALDSISADGTDINIAVDDNSATALTIKQGSDAYLIIDTANSSESVSIGTGISGTAITLGHSTSEVTVADNLTVTGDLTVSGTTTTLDTTNLAVTDPLVKYGQAYTGSGIDQGFIVTRGDGSSSNTQNMAFIWDESADQFAAIKAATEDGATAGNVTVTDYVDLHVGTLVADDALTVGGTNVLTGSLITTLGTISAGVWQGTAIASAYIAGDAITGAKIADDAIDSEHYTDASIDFAHIQNVAANSILGRDANSSGVLSEVALATTQILIGDGTGFTAAALSGDATMTNAGVVSLAAAQTNVNSLLATDIVIGEDAQTQIDFETANEIHFDADNAERVSITATGLAMSSGNILLNAAVADVDSTLCASGITAQFTAGEDLEDGECVYFKAADSKMWKAVAKTGGTGIISEERMCVAMCTADVSADATGTFLLQGFLRANTNFPTYTVGETLYLTEDEVGGKSVPTGTRPSTDGDFIQVVGWAAGADTVYFNPSWSIIEHA